MKNTATAYRDHREPAVAVRVSDPLLVQYHREWFGQDKHQRHEQLTLWRLTPDEAFYREGHSYLESLVRLTDFWLKGRPRSSEQVVALARAHRRKLQEVRRDLDKIMVARQRAAVIWRERSARQRDVQRTNAAARGYNIALAALDDDDDEL
jgi:hypothetical protein